MDDKQIIRLFLSAQSRPSPNCPKIRRPVHENRQKHSERSSGCGRMCERRLSWRMEQYSSSIPRPAESLYLPYRSQPLFEEASRNTAIKRGSQFEVSLSELEDCIPDNSMDEQLSISELSAQINAFLAALPKDDRLMFVKRYWFSESISELADAFGITENNVSVRLSRIRGKLHQYLNRNRRQTYNGSENRQAGVSHRRY